MNILLAGGGLQGLSCGASLYKKHKVSVIGKSLQIEKCHFFEHCFEFVQGEELYPILKQGHYDVLLPISDFTVPFISQHKKEIEEQFGVRCAVPDYEQVFIVEDKSRFMDFCQKNEVPHPKTVCLTKDTLDSAADYVGFPALIKPDYSVGARGITRVNNIEDLKREFPSVSEKYGTCTLQEFIDNKEYYYNVMLYRNNEGKILASAILKIVRMYPVGAGSSSCCITVENEELVRICSDCLEKLKWVGMADFDVLQRLDNGEYKIIEINARVPASLRGAAISGVNFPEIIVNDVMGGDVPHFEYTPGKVMRYMGLDLMWFMKSSNRFLSTPSWFKFFGKGLFYQDIFQEDASTWWTWLAEGIAKIGKRNKKLR
jgi:carbamoylphosphate synthase large subunit